MWRLLPFRYPSGWCFPPWVGGVRGDGWDIVRVCRSRVWSSVVVLAEAKERALNVVPAGDAVPAGAAPVGDAVPAGAAPVGDVPVRTRRAEALPKRRSTDS